MENKTKENITTAIAIAAVLWACYAIWKNKNKSKVISDGKYTFKQDYEAEGTNVVGAGMGIANFMLKYLFKRGERFAGTKISETEVEIETDGGTKYDGGIYNGRCVFVVPTSVLE